MPPPNHHVSPAAKKRTFMCTVGQYGLRGCSTSDTPIASNARPASCGRAALAEGGSVEPCTHDKFTPPRSKTPPSSMTRVSPPPPSARCHASLRNFPPSSASRAATMRACRPERYSWTASFTLISLLQGAVADVLAVLHALEADGLERLVGAGARHLHRIAERGDAQYAPAVRHQGLAFEARTGMEHAAIGGRLGQSADPVALARLFGVAGGGEDYAERGTPVPLRLHLVERALERAL